MRKKYSLLIIGSKSTALEIYHVTEKYFNDSFKNIYFLIGNNELKLSSNQIQDLEIESLSKTINFKYICSIANHKKRREFQLIMKQLGIDAFNIIHPSVSIPKQSKIGLGNYLAENVIIAPNVNIGNHNIINYNSVIGHDSLLKHNIIINPGVVVAGNVHVSSEVLIGSNSFIFQGVRINKNVLIDALTYIDKDIEKNMICSSKNLRIFKRVK